MAKYDISEIKGVIPALLTPFDKEENLDEKGLRALISKLINEGVNGLYLTGSTGEGFLMDLNERKRAVEIAMDEVNGRVPVIVHVGAIATKLSVELTVHASKAGADAISSVPPFYFRFSEDEIISYYKALAEASPLPMIVYNIPLAGLMGYGTLKKLAAIENVKGIKYTATTHFEITQLKEDIGKDFMVYSGADEMALSGLLAGADGIIGSTYNAIPDTFIKIYSLFMEGKIEDANVVMKEAVAVIMQMLTYGSLMSLLKAINRWEGVPAGYARKPFTNFTEEKEEEIKKDFIALKKKLGLKNVKFIDRLEKIMIARQLLKTDVLVIGAGIAGISAAIYAAKNGAKVALVSSTKIFSGSTFYPGTWGFGLIGPEDEKDEENLLETLRSVGQNMVIEDVAKTFVEKLNSSIDALENLGVTLQKPMKEAAGEKEYIPCFDYKHRRWRGLTKKNLLETLPQILKELEIEEVPFFEILELIKEGKKVTGAIGILEGKEAVCIRSKAVILATGGAGGIYKHKLTTDDVTGAGLSIALRAGARLVNLEFMQIMLGFVNPAPKTIYNEKTFFASRFYDEKGKEFMQSRIPKGLSVKEILKERSKHGPFSSSTISKYADLAIFDEMSESKAQGVRLKYDDKTLNTGSEFVREYFTWLKKEKHVDIEDVIVVAPFMHASNGGIEIDKYARTTVEGLFACGECTGGMHGADRIGGLSTANGIVFGKIAGEESARYVKENGAGFDAQKLDQSDKEVELQEIHIVNAKEEIKNLQSVMYKEAFLKRSEASLKKAMDYLESIELKLEPKGEKRNLLESYRLLNAMGIAKAILRVMDARKESRGSHYREDYKEINHKDFEELLTARIDSENEDILSFIKESPNVERREKKRGDFVVNIGIVGIGQIAEDYISIFAKGSIKDGKISALASRNQEHLDQIISKYHLEGVSKFKTIEDMLDSNLVDAVMITTPHTLHTEMATKVLAKGKHVLVDKPLGIKAGEVDKLADLAKMNPNLQAGVIFNRRSSELYQRVHSLVKSKELGELRRSIWQITNLYRTYAYYKSGSWRGSFKTEGGGVLMNQAIHQLDLLLWIAGMPEKVMARTKEGFHRPVFTENDVSIYMDYENGASGQFIASAHECPGTNRLELSFDKGQLIIEDDSKLTIRRLDQKEEDFAKQTLTYFDKVPYQEEKENYDFKPNTVEQAVIINNFIDAILGRVNLLCPFEESRNTVRVVNAAYLSSWRKEEVALDFDQEEYETALQGKIEIEENMKAKRDVL